MKYVYGIAVKKKFKNKIEEGGLIQTVENILSRFSSVGSKSTVVVN